MQIYCLMLELPVGFTSRCAHTVAGFEAGLKQGLRSATATRGARGGDRRVLVVGAASLDIQLHPVLS